MSSWSNQIVTLVLVAYLCQCLWSLYSLFQPVSCSPHSHNCLRPLLSRLPTPKMQLWLYASQFQKPRISDLTLLWTVDDFQPFVELRTELNVSIPKEMRDNGTLYAHIYLAPPGEDPFYATWKRYQMGSMISFANPRAVSFRLVSKLKDTVMSMAARWCFWFKSPTPVYVQQIQKDVRISQSISHWRSLLTINVMTDGISFDRNRLPADLLQYLESNGDEYLPVLYFDEMSCRAKDLLPLSKSAETMPLTIIYTPISYGRLLLYANMKESLAMLEALGLAENDSDEIKRLITETSLTLLLLTFLVAVLYLVFDFLAFKKGPSLRKTNGDSMVRLSTEAVFWQSIGTIVIFLYLIDGQTCLLALIPSGIASAVQIWKFLRTLNFKVKINWVLPFPSFLFNDEETKIQEFECKVMDFLAYILYVLCGIEAIYSLLFIPHKSWYSWGIKSLVNGAYAYGFILMLPPLIINYKMKSVAHLPWKAFVFKAIDTFIDDLFAFVITVPTAHRMACFRNDVIFVVYLYQRWLYPVDKSRTNEYGQSVKSLRLKKVE